MRVDHDVHVFGPDARRGEPVQEIGVEVVEQRDLRTVAAVACAGVHEHRFASDGARHLAAAGVRAVGADTIALEHIPAGGGLASLPVHRILLQDNGINLIEVMNLEPLAATGAREFVFVGAPLPIVGATGAPIRPLALA